jgi:hypothetical protein
MTLYLDPIRAISGGTVFAGAELTVTDGASAVTIYADPGLTVKLPNPIKADSAGRYPPIYVPEGTYTVEIPDASIDEEITVGAVPLSFDQGQPKDDDGSALPNAVRTFFQAGTTELATVYSDSGLSTESDNPLEANSSGVFATVYFDPDERIRAQLHESPGNPAFNPYDGYWTRRGWVGGRLLADHEARVYVDEEPPFDYNLTLDGSAELSWDSPPSPFRGEFTGDIATMIGEAGPIYLLLISSLGGVYIVAYGRDSSDIGDCPGEISSAVFEDESGTLLTLSTAAANNPTGDTFADAGPFSIAPGVTGAIAWRYYEWTRPQGTNYSFEADGQYKLTLIL